MERYIAVDWGTTNRRAWLVDRNSGVIAAIADDLGLLAIGAGGFPNAARMLRNQLGDWPMLLAGMVGSDKGWRTVPYKSCPADIAALAAGICWLDDENAGIVPGVCQLDGRADVMRGEEVQALGALALGSAEADGLICHPGTHSKWVQLESGSIAAFQTMMTGEIFSLLRTGSILSAQMQGEVTDDKSFEQGVDEALRGSAILSHLFRVRADHVLGQHVLHGASYASGLLIGSDVQAALTSAKPSQMVTVVGRSDLAGLYARAIAKAGFSTRTVRGGDAFLAGMSAIVEALGQQKGL